jgi:hypothetical protein
MLIAGFSPPLTFARTTRIVIKTRFFIIFQLLLGSYGEISQDRSLLSFTGRTVKLPAIVAGWILAPLNSIPDFQICGNTVFMISIKICSMFSTDLSCK